MSILQRYFATSIIQAVAFVLAVFLALLAFMDLSGELTSIGKNGYDIQHAFLYVLILIPGHVYEVMPPAALIGTIFTMAQFAASSEFTIMRASSMSTLMAAGMLFRVAVVFVVVTFVFGELIAPRTAPIAEQIKLTARGATVSQEFRTGLWTKDIVREGGVKGTPTGARFFNVHQVRPDGQLIGVRLYEFDNDFRMRSLIQAKDGRYIGNNTWRLQDVIQTLFTNTVAAGPDSAARWTNNFNQQTSVVATKVIPTLELVSEITPTILSVSSSDPERMSAKELSVYTRHLAENKQETERFKIAFWKKLFDPLAIFVLMALALPFGYLHSRSGGISLKIFIGIMLGVSFLLTNTLFSNLGMLSTWPAVVTASVPSLLYLMMALGFLWRVERH
jgi:lipopolysaccharide export system permease protein